MLGKYTAKGGAGIHNFRNKKFLVNTHAVACVAGDVLPPKRLHWCDPS